MMKNKAIVLLSGGLDSLVSLAYQQKNSEITFALTFNYGQKAFEKELFYSKKIAEYYNIKHEIIELNWLKNITNSTLVNFEEIPKLSEKDLEKEDITENSAKSVWIPNRNGLFLNIAACYADTYNIPQIIFGANIEEAKTFSDNSVEFVKNLNNCLKYSCQSKVEVISPLVNLNKTEIVKLGLDLNIPFEYIYSCYSNQEKNCGKCESCQRLKRALKANNRNDIIEKIFI